MKSELLRVPSVLNNLQNSKSTEQAIATLTTLNEIISSSQDEREFLYKIDGFHTILKYMERNDKLTNSCLKIFANASKKDEKIRIKLSKSNIFSLLAIHLNNETDFSKGSLILYSALIAILVQGNCEAQYQMKSTGCLSRMTYILSSILDDAENSGILCKNTELVVYAITACIKDPRHPENQTEIGWITPKVLDYLRKYFLSNGDQLELIKCFWSFLKSILDGNEVNQNMFLKSSGMIVLFRCFQEVLDGGKCDEMGELLTKMTNLLLKLKSHKDFLHQTANYCSVLILCNLLKTCNYLVIQHVITFLDSLTQEIPLVLAIMRNSQIKKTMKRTQIILLKTNSISILCQNVCQRIGIQHTPSQEAFSSGNFKPILEKASTGLVEPEINYQTHSDYCVLHDSSQEIQVYSGSLFENFNDNFINKSSEDKIRDNNLHKLRLSVADLNFHRGEVRKREKRLKEIVKETFADSQSLKNNKVFNNTHGKGLFHCIWKCLTYFFRSPEQRLSAVRESDQNLWLWGEEFELPE